MCGQRLQRRTGVALISIVHHVTCGLLMLQTRGMLWSSPLLVFRVSAHGKGLDLVHGLAVCSVGKQLAAFHQRLRSWSLLVLLLLRHAVDVAGE